MQKRAYLTASSALLSALRATAMSLQGHSTGAMLRLQGTLPERDLIIQARSSTLVPKVSVWNREEYSTSLFKPILSFSQNSTHHRLSVIQGCSLSMSAVPSLAPASKQRLESPVLQLEENGSPRSVISTQEEHQELTEKGPEGGSTTSADSPARRRRSTAASRASAITSDLLSVPGVGPRNLEKLRAKGIDQVEGLKQLYREKFVCKEAAAAPAMVNYLRSTVGIARKDHATLITDHVHFLVAKESAGSDEPSRQDDNTTSGEGEQGATQPKKKDRLTFCVEGNISVGKSTFLKRIVGDHVELHDLVELVPEPIGKWQHVGGSDHNLLKAFYEDPRRYAYTFQNYVFITRIEAERETAEGVRPLRLMERSIFSDRMIFVRAVHEAKWMSDLELAVYDSWYDPIVSLLPGLVPDGFIYLRANPETCHRRLVQRARAEETSVDLAYLRNLHGKHEQWLLPADSDGPQPRLALSPHWGGSLGLKHAPVQMPESIRGAVYALEGTHMHAQLQQVPALVLDCDQHIDFNVDRDKKQWYGGQVKAFFDFVSGLKQAQEAERTAAGCRPNSPLVLPSLQAAGGLHHAGGFPRPQALVKQ